MSSSDRGVRLDLFLPQGMARGAGQERPGDAPGGEPSAQDRERFEQALSGQGASPQGEAAGEGEPPPLPLPPNPFALFGALRSPAPPPDEASSRALWRELERSLQRLMVGEGRSGGQQVRMELDESLLPGVTVVIEQAEGRLLIEFLCRVERSYQRLATELPVRAPQLAERLHRELLLRVQMHGLEALSLEVVVHG